MKNSSLFLFVCLTLFSVGCNRSLQNDVPDYSVSANWASLPEITKPVDVIYLYPTTYRPVPGDGTYSTIDDSVMHSGAYRCLELQASTFNTTGNIFAPFYRQCDAGILAGLTSLEVNELLREVPLRDVCAALDYYFEHYNDGRPFIMAGHSQGSNVLTLVLSEYMASHSEYYSRMIAAYVIGFSVTENYLAANPHLKFAREAHDLGVIVSYNTEAPENEGQYSLVINSGGISINPLNWRRNNTPAGVEENLGSLIPVTDGVFDRNGTMELVVPGIADARVNPGRGVVLCTSVPLAEFSNPVTSLFGPGSYHTWDYSFYYMNIRQNAQLRADTWMASHPGASTE